MALLVGLAASSALVDRRAFRAFWRPPQRLVAIALAFASGALITALAFDLLEEAFKAGGPWIAGSGLLVGAAAFVVADELLDRYGGSSRFALLAGVTLDGVPENLALGVGLIGSSLSGILALLVGIFASNLPEALGGAVDMRNGGRSRGFVVVIWTATAVLLIVAVVGNVLFMGCPRMCWPSRVPSPPAPFWPRWPTRRCPTLAGKAVPWSPSPRPPASCLPS
jgi:zinc transporter, ZIP family